MGLTLVMIAIWKHNGNQNQGLGLPFKRKRGGFCTADLRRAQSYAGFTRAKVEHPFRIVEDNLVIPKSVFRGLFKMHEQLYLLFALANLYHVRKVSMPSSGIIPVRYLKTSIRGLNRAAICGKNYSY